MRAEQRTTFLTFLHLPSQTFAMSGAEVFNHLPIFVLRTAVAWLPLLGCHVSREREQRNMSRWPPNGRNTTSHSPVLEEVFDSVGASGRGASVEGAGSPDDWTASGLQERFGGGGLGVPSSFFFFLFPPIALLRSLEGAQAEKSA